MSSKKELIEQFFEEVEMEKNAETPAKQSLRPGLRHGEKTDPTYSKRKGRNARFAKPCPYKDKIEAITIFVDIDEANLASPVPYSSSVTDIPVIDTPKSFEIKVPGRIGRPQKRRTIDPMSRKRSKDENEVRRERYKNNDTSTQ